MSKIKTLEQFIIDAKRIHYDKYNYANVNYINAKTKIDIICPKHGLFKQTPSNHLQGKGCPKCNNGIRSNKEDFIKKANLIHNNKYSYDKMNYVNSKTKIKVLCPIHGEFTVTPSNHINNHSGCPKCKGGIQLTQNEFIEKAYKIHGNQYDYSKVNYINTNIPVTIICNKHGEFRQKPIHHLQGHGCVYCNKSHLENEILILLLNNNIKFYSECNKNILEWLDRLTLDFYLPEYNIAIECQGIQHFEPTNFFNKQEKYQVIENFNKQIERDNVKYNLCQRHNINIIYYSNIYLEYNKPVIHDISEILRIINNKN